MMNLTELKSGEKLSFFGLFNQKDLIIEIPIIQRDYAQGRKGSQAVRDRFLEALADYLEQNIPGRDLDFVYGSILKDESKCTFIPLDGQQRLTTLFLLHWYLAQISGNEKAFRDKLRFEDRSRFTYETRASAREFCDSLITKPFSYSAPADGKKISKLITNSHWYFLSWNLDPTIQSMLIMLDALEQKFHQHQEYYDRLTDLDNPVITFQFLNLKEFKLTDDLYIKMNSRGKMLTPFENFKAKFEQGIKNLFNKEPITYPLSKNGSSRDVSAQEYFANKIDTNWLDFFWKASGNKPKLVDAQIMNFIRVALANHLSIKKDDSLTWEAIQRPYNFKILIDSQDVRKERETDNLTYFDFVEFGAVSKDSIHYLIQVLDKTSESSQSIKDQLDPFFLDYDTVLNKALNNSLTAQERVKFHALICFLLQNGTNIDNLNSWMRVIHNLSENTRLDVGDTLFSALQSVNQMSTHSGNILAWLSSTDSKVSTFYGRQVEEEQIKAHLILKGDEWSETIYTLERSPFFFGQIGFVLEFAGLFDVFLGQEGFNQWDATIEKTYLSTFISYANKADSIFNHLSSESNQDFLWERAVLVKGNYLISASYNRLNFLHTNVSVRDYSWKRLLRLNRKSDWNNSDLTTKRLFVKEVFDDPRFDPNKPWKSCELIIKDSADDWRIYFLNNPELIRVCEHGFIRHEGELNIRLQTKTKLTYHYELRTYNLYLQTIKGNNYDPFDESDYWWAYGDGEICCIYLGSWSHKRKEYLLKMYFEPDNLFSLEFSKSKGQKDQSDYSDDIIQCFQQLGYKFDLTEWNGFYTKSKNERGILKKLNGLCTELNSITNNA
ncbi:MAG: DUF262 domain-containing protein [Cyclobacteriaceae bacterium]